MGKVLAIIGIILSLGYGLFSWWLVGGRLGELQTMDLNEVGDFLAGAFGPLAILWLVLGFFQQGIELRQGTEALNLQASELRASVDQQKELVGISTDQLNMAKENAQLENKRLASSVEPKFSITASFKGQSGDGIKFLFRLFNAGHTISCVQIKYEQNDVLGLDLLGHLQDVSFTRTFQRGDGSYSGSVFIEYLNGLEENRSKKFDVLLTYDANLSIWRTDIVPKNGVFVDPRRLA